MALHCPATLLIARHGEADTTRPGHLSDEDGWLTPRGRREVESLAASLSTRRVAAVWTSAMGRAVESGGVAARRLGVGSFPLDGLEEVHVGSLEGRRRDDARMAGVLSAWAAGDLDVRVPGGESGHAVLARYHEALLTIADQHRGETVLVFSHEGVMAFCLPRLSTHLRDDLLALPSLPSAVPAEIEVGDDGVIVHSWPGQPDVGQPSAAAGPVRSVTRDVSEEP